jgi:diacylglycerol O-acyltransferase / wax synthase
MRMKQLSGLDATFLYLETPEMPMHVGALHVFELPAAYKGRFVNDLRRHMAARLPIAPALRRKLAWMPLNLANPAWVDAEPDMKAHVVELRLPKIAKGGTEMGALEALVSRLHPQLLDRTRPLWKFHVVEGLARSADGHKRVALYTQLHHAAVDGQAAVALANATLDATPEPRKIELKPSSRPRKFELGLAEMLSGAVANQMQQLAHLVRSLPSTVGTLSGAAAQVVAGRKPKVTNLTLAPRTRLNASVTNERAFAAVSVPLHELKALGRLHDATINDLVLWLCSTALRRQFGKRGPLPRKSMIAAVPVSLREKGDATSDNQASMSLVNLGTNVADPGRRLKHIKAATASMKAMLGKVKSILPTNFPSVGVPWLMEAATAIVTRTGAADRIPPVANVVISNVPGPAMPLYMAGARMLTNYPTSIVVHGIALNITVQSYDQSLDFGLMACAKAMPDVRELADAIAVAFDDLRALPVDDGDLHDVAPAPQRAAKMARDVITRATQTASKTAARAIPKPIAKPIAKAARTARRAAVNPLVRATVAALPGAARSAIANAVGGAARKKSRT